MGSRVVAVSLVLLSACDEAPSAPPHATDALAANLPKPPAAKVANTQAQAEQPVQQQCPYSIEDYCRTRSCKGFDAAVSAAQQYEPCSVGETGTCGDFKYVKSGAWFSHSTTYYDAHDRVVAVREHTDMIVPNQCLEFGAIPKCTETPSRALCPHRSSRAE